MYLFNPENDLALANFSPNYTPPASATRLAEELAVLPIWYAGRDAATPVEEGLVDRRNAAMDTASRDTVDRRDTKVIAGGELNRSFLETVKKILPLQPSLIPFSDIALYPDMDIVPWGWNPMLRKKLISVGVNEQLLPSPEDLVRLRNYSNRRHAVEILSELQAEEAGCCGESHFFIDDDELYAWLQSVPGNKVLKMPLSGSGKGLIWILDGITDKQRDWCRRVAREQGGVVAEPVLDKIQDFAMEFYLDKRKVSFAGYSMFTAASSGAYMGNELLSDARIEEKLSTFVSVELLHWLRESLIKKLSDRFPLYTGYAGVDMMVCEISGGYCLQPCVEVNMRMNMGMVARIFHDCYLHAGAEGRFTVDYCKKPGSALSFHEKMQRESPLMVENGKILSGYLSLTPVTDTTNYIAYVKVF